MTMTTNEELLIGLLSISDRAAQGVYEDQGIPALQDWFGVALSSPWRAETRLIADDQASIERTLIELVDELGCHLVLTTGGTGKSPFVLWLAGKLKARGLQPAILTRGYRRRTAEKYTIVGPGEYADVSRTGDEAQSYLRAAIGPVGIAADRAGAGRLIEERFHPAVFLLDDGFQHYRLERALDIVLIDALNPFGGGAAVPLGSLREGLGALRRAGIVVITRWEEGRKTDGIEAVIRRYNPDVPIFRARVAAETWRPEPPSGPAAAFCGLGNPDSFWQTLRGLGIQPVLKRVFPDHHRYSGRELSRLVEEARAAGAEVLLTTAKDYMNLPGDWKEAIGELRLAWLEIRVEVENEEEFLGAVTAAIFPGL